MNEVKKQGNPTDHLANERTFLAWVRTSITIMAFGFVVVKFSLFVRQISLLLGNQNVLPQKGYSGMMGVVLVGVGTIISVFSYIRYRQAEKKLNEGYYTHSSWLITVLTAFIFLVSIFLIVYLVNSI